MIARVSIIVEWELGEEKEYDEEVSSWSEAIKDDMSCISISRLDPLTAEDRREVKVSVGVSRIEVFVDPDSPSYRPEEIEFKRPDPDLVEFPE